MGMAAQDALAAELQAGYGFEDDAIVLGRALAPDLETPITSAFVQVPLASLNRHGLVAGATGTGKTKTLQVMAEQLSRQGIPVFLADLKGDLTGLGVPSAGHPKIDERMSGLDIPWTPEGFPVELLSLTGEHGTPLRVPVSEFGPLLLAKVMDCTDTQESVLHVVFRFADDQQMALLDLEDLVAVLRFLTSDEGREVQDTYGGMATSSLNVLLRKAMELDEQGAEQFFGEPAFDVVDLLRQRDDRGVITIMNLTDVQTKPRIFSTFMMWLLAELYETSPELGDPERPELVFFLDEAHLLFEGASKALREAIETTVRMIRSKGVGVFFVTQSPTDLPDDVLGQLGNRVQHALRAYTPQDQKAMSRTAATFPRTDHYDVAELLQSVGTGEALVTVLGPDGVPTPTVPCRLVAPVSTMDVVDDATVQELVAAGDLGERYATEVDRESAAEILAARMAQREAEQRAEEEAAAEEASRPAPRGSRGAPRDGAGTGFGSAQAWGTAEDVIAAIAPHGKKGLARRATKLLRGILGTRTGG